MKELIATNYIATKFPKNLLTEWLRHKILQTQYYVSLKRMFGTFVVHERAAIFFQPVKTSENLWFSVSGGIERD